MTCLLRALLLSCLVFVLPWSAGATVPQGYVQDVRKEREERFYEIFLFAQPPPVEKSLHDKIFNEELSREFRGRYRDKFGTVDTDAIAYQRTDFERLDAYRSTTAAEAKNNERRSFADYIMKRLVETHVDNYVKSEPTMRPIYEAKEKLKKMEVRVNKETKLEARYSLAGNILDLLLENPYCDARLSIEMDSGTVGPAPVKEQILIVSRPLSSTWRAENRWFDRDGRVYGEFIKSHTSRFSTTYGVNAAFKDGENERDSRLAFGLGYSF